MSRTLREGEVRASAAPVLDERARRRLGWSGLAAVAAVLTLLVLLPARLVPPARVPTSLGTGPEDFRAFVRTLDALGLPAAEYLSSYGALADAGDHLLVSLAPAPAAHSQHATHRMDAAQVRALDGWLRAGGAWLVALPHGRTGSPDSMVDGTFATVTDPDDPLSLLGELPQSEWIPARGLLVGHGALAGVTADLHAPARFAGDWPAALRKHPDGTPRLRAFTAADQGWTTLLELDGHPLALLRPDRYTGGVVLASTPLLFSNLGLGAVHTGPLAVRLLHFAAERGRRRALVDEFGHGLVQDRSLWWIAKRHGFGGLLIALAALLVILGWRGAIRRAPPIAAPRTSRRAATEFVVALADVAHRAGRARRSGERFLEGHELLARRRGDRETLRQLAALRRDLPRTGAFGPRELRALARKVDRIHSPSPAPDGDLP